MSISANAQFRNNKWYFGSGCGIEFDANGNIINTKLPSKIDTEEGSASIDITDKLSLYSDGITVWDNAGNIVLDKLSSNKSCTQAAMFLPRVLNGRISYVDVISLINFARPEGAAISRIFFDEQSNYSTRPNMTNVKFTKDYLLEEKMAGFINYQVGNKFNNVLVFKAYRPIRTKDSLFLMAQIGAYKDSFEIELKEKYFGELTTNSHLNSTGYFYNGQVNALGSIISISPEDGLIQNFILDPYGSYAFYSNENYSLINRILKNYLINIYGIGTFVGKPNNIMFTNTSSKLFLLRNQFVGNPVVDLDSARIAKTIDSIDIGKLFNEPDISLGAIQSFYTTSPPTYKNMPSYIAVQGKNYIIKVMGDVNNNTVKLSKENIGCICQLGLPTRPNLINSCAEMIDYKLFGESEKVSDTIKLNYLKNTSCGGISFNNKFNVNDVLRLSFQFQIAKGNNNKLYDGSEEGADGLAIVLSKEKIDKCQTAAGGLGYSGLRNAIALELDLFKNQDNNDPDGNHVYLKVPDSTGLLTAKHHPKDLLLKSYGKIQTSNGNYFLSLSNQNNFSYFSIDSLYDPDKKLSPQKFSAFGQLSLTENIRKYVGTDDFYITIFGSTGDAVEEHNLYDIQLCKGFNFEASNPTSIENIFNEYNPNLTEKEILTSQEARKLHDELLLSQPKLKVFDINGKQLDPSNINFEPSNIYYFIEINGNCVFKKMILII